MKTRSNYLVFASLLLVLMLVSLASATVSMTMQNSSLSTNPSDDTNTRTLVFNFNLVSDEAVNVILSQTGFDSSWSPTPPSSISLGINSNTSHSLTLTVPKYKSQGSYPGTILVNLTNSASPNLTSAIQVDVNSLNSLIFTSPSIKLSKGSNVSEVVLKNDGNTQIDGISLSIFNNSVVDSEGNVLSLTLNPTGSFSLGSQQNKSFNVTFTGSAEDVDLLLGDTSTTIKAVSTNGANATTTLNFNNEYCDFGELGNDVRIVSVNDDSSSNGNFNWKLLEDQEIEVKIENNGNSDEDITVQIILYDPKNGNELFTAEDTVSVNQDDRESVLFNFTLPADTPDNAKLYVKAYMSEDEQCSNHWGSSKSETINLKSRSSWDIGMSEIKLESTLMCGERSTIEATISNIGKEDQKKVLVSLTSDELKIDQDILITNLDSGDSKKISFPITIPEDMQEKIYQVELQARHHYSKSNDNYEDLTDKILRSITVNGRCVISQPVSQLTISPSLDSEAQAGSDLVVRTIIKNNGADFASVSVIPFGYEAWATLKSVEPSTITLNSGESREVRITLTPNADTSGDQRFTIRASYGSKLSDQEVSVFVKAKSTWNILSSIKENWVIWVIVIANIILILAIIIAAVKLSKN